MPLLSHPCPLRAGFIDPCLPMPARVPPSGPDWIHEIKHDGYRLIARLDGRRTRLFSRRKTGLSLFDRLHSDRHDGEVVLYAFDLLELNGADLRPLPIEERKAKLAALIAPLATGILLSEHIEEDGATVFRHACKLGCEGIVSKRRASPYFSGRVRTWIKVKNAASPAMTRAWER